MGSYYKCFTDTFFSWDDESYYGIYFCNFFKQNKTKICDNNNTRNNCRNACNSYSIYSYVWNFWCWSFGIVWGYVSISIALLLFIFYNSLERKIRVAGSVLFV